jgi:transcriptional regulator with XRE-family HTH domain
MSKRFVYPVIDMRATGVHLKELLDERGITVQDVQEAMGFASKQAVYHWLNGSNMPSVDNLYALSRYLNVQMENVIVEKAA